MPLRLFIAAPLATGLEFALPDDAARHVQVRRLQPGAVVQLFDGHGGEWQAVILRMGKRKVDVRVDAHESAGRELPFDLGIALGMPANERMDALIEKATELGVAFIQPLQTERSVLRLDAERAAKRVAHWQAVAVGASEQSGRTRVPVVAPVRTLAAWLAALAEEDVAADGAPAVARRLVMSTGDAPSLAERIAAAATSLAAGPAMPAAAGPATPAVAGPATPATGIATTPAGPATSLSGTWVALSGPEGGLAPDEEAAAVARGFAPISLGPRILRADTAPLAWLAQMAVLLGR